jgi:cobalamin biosynthesis protein CobD/CbiB
LRSLWLHPAFWRSAASCACRRGRGSGDLVDDGRAAVAKIVGRDVSALDASGVARAAMRASPEFSDGVVAPARSRSRPAGRAGL